MPIDLILACPACTIERMQPTWVAFAALRLAIVAGISFRRFDLVRILGLFALYEVIYYYLWTMAVWYSHPAVADGPLQIIASGVLALISFGIPAALILLAARKSKYLRGNAPAPFTKTRASLLVLLLAGAAVFQEFQSH